MSSLKQKLVGLNKTNGFEVGAKKTFPVSVDNAWNFLLSRRGINIWLGQVNFSTLNMGDTFQTKDGLVGKITVFKIH